jgi:hypothetical protein
MNGKLIGKLNSILSGGFFEAMWETMIALATAAGICTGLISLADHLNETRISRSAGEPSIAAHASKDFNTSVSPPTWA